jgi:hypothetical protein
LKRSLAILLLIAASRQGASQTEAVAFPVGAIVPHITCLADAKQSYALYLPSTFSATRKWPIIYDFDPFAHGPDATEVVRAAAEKFGYIVVASNNSKNGPAGGSRDAAQAMWQDTHQRLPIDPNRQYFAGLSGGARVATSLALSCGNCAAGVIANAAGFPTNAMPSAQIKFAYFATVGNADFNYAEFAQLRPKLEAIGVHYLIRTFDGPHGWAPADVWLEALEWMDLQAMAAGTLQRHPARINAAVAAGMSRAKEFEVKGDLMAAVREYEAIVRNFGDLTDVTMAKARVSELQKNKSFKKAEKQEAAELDQQERLEATPSAQMQKLPTGELDAAAFTDLRNSVTNLKRQAAGSDRASLVTRRALSGLVVQAYESGQSSMDQKNYSVALQYFDLAAAGSANPAWAYYQSARVYAITSDKKSMLSELRKCLTAGVHDASALDLDEFQRYRDQPEFKAVAEEWKRNANP